MHTTTHTGDETCSLNYTKYVDSILKTKFKKTSVDESKHQCHDLIHKKERKLSNDGINSRFVSATRICVKIFCPKCHLYSASELFFTNRNKIFFDGRNWLRSDGSRKLFDKVWNTELLICQVSRQTNQKYLDTCQTSKYILTLIKIISRCLTRVTPGR